MPRGMRALVDQFYVRLPKDLIHFGQKVDGVYWMPGDGHSEQRPFPGDKDKDKDKDKEYPVKVTTLKGRQWQAKHVISTLPLGVLKRSHDKIFHPPLPPLKVETETCKTNNNINRYW